MSTEQQTSSKPPATQRAAVAVYNVARPGTEEEVDHIVVYGHSNLFYWWPVWLSLEQRTEGTRRAKANGSGIDGRGAVPARWRMDDIRRHLHSSGLAGRGILI